MNFNSIKFVLLSLLIIFVLAGCGRYGWEPIDNTTDPKLNIMAVLALDDSVESVVVVHRTLSTSGPSFVRTRVDSAYYYLEPRFDDNNQFSGYDTVWHDGYIDSSLYLVPAADVRISDGLNEWTFSARPYGYQTRYYQPLLDGSAAYYPDDPGFSPQPNTSYTLRVNAPGGLSATGSLTTPPLPQFHADQIADTLSIKSTYRIDWVSPGQHTSDITAGIPYSNWDEEEEDVWICGSDQYRLLRTGDSTWTSAYPSFCLDNEEWLDPIYDSLNANAVYEIRLRHFEDNYYDYFMVNNEGNVAITNFLLGEGNIGLSAGIEGGYGVFGAFSTARIQRVVIP